jgi:hypothetical protein
VSSSVGKRQRERQKIEKAQFKAERKAARRADLEDPAEPATPVPVRDEAELIEELATLHRTFEDGAISVDDFEEQRLQLQEQLEQIL